MIRGAKVDDQKRGLMEGKNAGEDEGRKRREKSNNKKQSSVYQINMKTSITELKYKVLT